MRRLHFIFFALLLVQHPFLIHAQENDIGRVTGNRLFQFDKKDMTPIGVGHIVSIGKKNISVKLSSGKTISLQVSLLSKKDTDRLKYIKKELQAITKARTAAEKLETQLFKDDPKTQIKVCRRLRSLKISTNNLLRELKRIVDETNNSELAYEALMAFAETCNTSNENLEFVVNRGAKKHQRNLPQIKYDPEDFILALSRWNSLSINYLKQFAFSGDLILPPEKDFLSKPITLPLIDVMRTKVRTYASISIGSTQINFPETYYTTTPLLLEILSSAEVSMNNQFDRASVRAIILALGRQGCKTGRPALNRLKQTFPVEVDFALKTLNENTKILDESSRVYMCTFNRFYFAKNGKDFIWANVQSRVGDNVIFLDQNRKRFSVPLDSFSPESQEKIIEKWKRMSKN